MPSFYQLVPPSSREPAGRRPEYFVRNVALDRERDAAERWRTVCVSVIIGMAVAVAVFALLQAGSQTRREYVPVPTENVVVTAQPAPGPPARDRSVYVAPVMVHTWDSVAAPAVRNPAPAMPTTRMPVAAGFNPAPVDYAARDRQVADLKRRIEEIDERIRQVRADPHYYGWIKGSTNTSRQQSSDDYLKELDQQRNDLRREKWKLEGR